MMNWVSLTFFSFWAMGSCFSRLNCACFADLCCWGLSAVWSFWQRRNFSVCFPVELGLTCGFCLLILVCFDCV
uniref:Uncharacterized protein n=1 Tax=Rhizophora mucronata TaxID=61149 RepID=A0A2P2NV27_RHIMU